MGTMPNQLLPTLSVLLPKPTTGFRTVGLFPSLYRVLLKQQGPALQQWEANHPHPCFSFQGGQNALHTVWCQAAEAERATMSKEVRGDLHANGTRRAARMYSGAFLWDMSDYYERIHRPSLRHRHGQLDFRPLWLHSHCASITAYAFSNWVWLCTKWDTLHGE